MHIFITPSHSYQQKEGQDYWYRSITVTFTGNSHIMQSHADNLDWVQKFQGRLWKSVPPHPLLNLCDLHYEFHNVSLDCVQVLDSVQVWLHVCKYDCMHVCKIPHSQVCAGAIIWLMPFVGRANSWKLVSIECLHCHFPKQKCQAKSWEVTITMRDGEIWIECHLCHTKSCKRRKDRLVL